MKILTKLLIFIILQGLVQCDKHIEISEGAIIRGAATRKELAIVFTGDEFSDGGFCINEILDKKNVKASFFFTGNFYRNPNNEPLITGLISSGHYLGAHSDRHLLYCDWDNRDSLLVDFETFWLQTVFKFEVINNFTLVSAARILFFGI